MSKFKVNDRFGFGTAEGVVLHTWTPRGADLAYYQVKFDECEPVATFTASFFDKHAVRIEPPIEPFTPGTVIRYGRDHALYIRNFDGTWGSYSIGSAGSPARANPTFPSGDAEWRKILASAEEHAEVVYESPGTHQDEYAK